MTVLIGDVEAAPLTNPVIGELAAGRIPDTVVTAFVTPGTDPGTAVETPESDTGTADVTPGSDP